MGLDVSHDCWHGAYSAFMRWRRKLADLAGFPPLDLMDGFYEHGCLVPTYPDLSADESEKPAACAAMSRSGYGMPPSVFRNHHILASLPIPWDHFRLDPLHKLLCHSDCDGEIASHDCDPIASRLEAILPLLPDEDGGGHVRNWRETTQKFIDGLRLAAVSGENVSFG